MIQRDVAQCAEIEDDCFNSPWDVARFRAELSDSKNIAYVAETPAGEIIGFMFAKLEPAGFRLMSIAVHVDFRRQGVGTMLIDRITGKLSNQLGLGRRVVIMTTVPESALHAQLFLQRHGFFCYSIVNDYYVQPREAAYIFRCDYNPPALIEAAKKAPKKWKY